jgi:hypothetical protein
MSKRRFTMRRSKASKSDLAKIERIIRQGDRYTRRRFVAKDRAELREWVKGGLGDAGRDN